MQDLRAGWADGQVSRRLLTLAAKGNSKRPRLFGQTIYFQVFLYVLDVFGMVARCFLGLLKYMGFLFRTLDPENDFAKTVSV